MASLAERLWRGLPLLWQDELQRFTEYMTQLGQPLRLGDLELWIERVQKGECPVAGSGCASPVRGSRFCVFHRRIAPPGL